MFRQSSKSLVGEGEFLLGILLLISPKQQQTMRMMMKSLRSLLRFLSNCRHCSLCRNSDDDDASVSLCSLSTMKFISPLIASYLSRVASSAFVDQKRHRAAAALVSACFCEKERREEKRREEGLSSRSLAFFYKIFPSLLVDLTRERKRTDGVDDIVYSE